MQQERLMAELANVARLFESTLAWLKQNYSQYHFFAERDIVWTLQLRLRSQIEDSRLPLRIFNDYPILPGKRRSVCTDLALLDETGTVLIAAEFKYEPSHQRSGKDIWPTKLDPSVVFWGTDGVGKDVLRVHEFVADGAAKMAYSIFVDEGGYFYNRSAHPNSEWLEWENGVKVLFSCAQKL